MSESRFMSVKKASRYLGISENTIRSWIRLKKIPHVRPVGRILLDKQALDRWLAARAVPESRE